jgi:hypothetical protein
MLNVFFFGTMFSIDENASCVVIFFSLFKLIVKIMLCFYYIASFKCRNSP